MSDSLIRSTRIGSIYIQSGYGVPTHINVIGSLYVDLNTGILYINKNGVNFWAQEIDATGGTIFGPMIFTGGVTANTISATTIDKVDYINFNTNPIVPSPTGGTLYFDSTENALSYKPVTLNNDVTVNIGEESVIFIYNGTGSQINNGTPLSITGSTSGSPSVTLAIASGAGTDLFQVDGISTHDIPANTFGFMTNFGKVHDVNLTAFTNGELIYLSQTIPGEYISNSQLFVTGRTCEVGRVLDNSSNGILNVIINNETKITNNTLSELNILTTNDTSSGVFAFSGITKVSNTGFTVSPAKGWIVDNTTNPLNPNIKYIDYGGAVNIDSPYRVSDTITYLLLTSASTLTLQPTPPTPQQRRQNIYLGKIGHPDKANFSIAFQLTDYALSPASQLRDMFIPIPLINGGIQPFANGANLFLNNTAGVLYGLGISFPTNTLNPNSISISAGTQISFQYRTQTGGTLTTTTSVDPLYYDLNGVRTAVGTPAKQATNQRIYMLQDGSFRIQYGQTVYADLATALSNISTENFVTFPNFKDNGILIGILSLESHTTALNNTSKARITSVSKFGEATAGAGSSGGSSLTLQQVYNNSSNPEIVTTVAQDGVQFRGGTGSNTDANIIIEDNSGVQTGRWNANGGLTASTISAATITTPGVIINNGLTATTISATTYQNLPTDIRVTGGTYSASVSTIIFTNNTGGTFNVTGITATGGGTFTGGTVTGSTIFTAGLTANTISATTITTPSVTLNNGLTAGTISATTYQNLPTDIRVTGGTYTAGTSTFTNNTGGTFSVTGFSKYFVTGATPSGVTINNGDRWFDTTNGIELVYFNDGDSSQWVQTNDSATITGDYLPLNGGTVTGATTFTAGLYANIISATTYQNLPTDIRVTGSTYSNNTFTYTNNTGGTFNVLFNTLTGLTVNGNLTVTGTTSSSSFTGSNITISGSKGSVVTSGSSTTAFINVSGSNTVGGTGYTDFIRVTNTAAGATNANKTIRVNITGGIEFLNSVYTATTLTLSDNGILSVGGGNLATSSSNDGTNNYLSFNGNNSQIYDDGNMHIHSRGAGQSMWINANGGTIIMGNQAPVGGGSVAAGVAIGSGTSLNGYVTIHSIKSFSTSAAYGYLTTAGAGTFGGGAQTLPISLYAAGRIWGTEIDAFSDERMKDIQGEITLEEGLKLVNNLKPIKYTWKESEDKGIKAGYSAQQVVKAGFNHLIGVIPKEGLEETIDDDGFVSPKDTQFSMNYDQVTPYHGVVIKHLLDKIEELELTIKDLQNKIK